MHLAATSDNASHAVVRPSLMIGCPAASPRPLLCRAAAEGRGGGGGGGAALWQSDDEQVKHDDGMVRIVTNS